MADNNTFLVTVADSIILDPTTGQAIAYGKANMSTAFELSMAETAVRAGKNNALLYNYKHDRDLMITIQQATFYKNFLALNVGSNILNTTVNVLNTDCVMLTGGAGVLSETPIGNVSVIKADGSIVTVTPSGKNITVPAGGNTKVTAIYRYSDTVDRVSISTTEPPKIVTVILLAEVRDSSNTLVEELQIEVPRVQIDGNYQLSLSADGVSNETLSGKALKVDGNTCSDGDTYGYVSWVPKTNVAPSIVDIAGQPSSIDVSASGTLPKSVQITVLGIRGGMFTNITLTSGLTFAKVAGGDADITVSAGGLVTVASGATVADTADILVTYTDGTNTFKDTVTVTVVA